MKKIIAIALGAILLSVVVGSICFARLDHSTAVVDPTINVFHTSSGGTGLKKTDLVKGDIMQYDTATPDSWKRLPASIEGRVLTTHGAGSLATWAAVSGFAETTAKVQSYSFMPAQMLATTTAGMTFASNVETSSSKVNYGKLSAADGSTVLHSEFSLELPGNYDGSTIAVNLFWTPSANDASNKYFVGVKAIVVGSGDAIDASWGTAVTHVLDPTAAGLGKVFKTAYAAITPSGTLAGNKWLIIDVYRDPTQGTDAATGTFILTGAQVLIGENHYSE